MGEAPGAEKTDPQTAERVRVQKQFEKTMKEKELLEADGSVRLEHEKIQYDQPPGTEQTAG
jgi:hypothetical protein